jgi:hypothetical protein
MRIRDPGWKKFVFGINIPDPQHCSRLDLTHLWIDLIRIQLDLIHTRLDFIHIRLDLTNNMARTNGASECQSIY